MTQAKRLRKKVKEPTLQARVSGGRGGGSAQQPEQRFPCSLWRSPGRSRFILKDYSLWEGPTLERGRKEDREDLLWTNHSTGSSSHCISWGGRDKGVGSEGVNLSLGEVCV